MGNVGTQRAHGDDSPVMNETLSVIQEHITDMRSPRQSSAVSRHRLADSGSDYSSHLDPRLSYITGHETDEEEDGAVLESEVMKWSPAQVAEYLGDVGVEEAHCKVFVEQEISGEVLLGMDQSSLLIKDLELGPVGRRLRTWHKIKAFQDEVRGPDRLNRNTVDFAAAEVSQDDSSLSRSSTPAPTMLPRIPSLVSRSNSKQEKKLEAVQIPQSLQPRQELSSPLASIPDTSFNRPSAASVREMNHSRRHSSVDSGTMAAPTRTIEGNAFAQSARVSTSAAPHRKQASFDRNWTMGDAPRPASGVRSSTARSSRASHIGVKSSEQTALEKLVRAYDDFIPSQELDRGYVSGGEVENRRSRNYLKKRGSAGHLRKSSYTEEQRHRSATTHTRQSRYGSADSIRDYGLSSGAGASSSPSQPFYNKVLKNRNSSAGNVDTAASRHRSKEVTSPTVTRLEYGKPAVGFIEPFVVTENKTENQRQSVASPSTLSNLQTNAVSSKPRVTGLRAISDAVTDNERAGLKSTDDTITSPTSEPALHSPNTNGLNTPTTAKSADADSAGSTKASPTAGSVASIGTVRRKAKQETSAYIRGLEKKSPAEQMEGCDYSGWMKKKSNKLLATWKPRLFVLRGRRLSYYYSEDDEVEKGLIDISGHRVLAADNDRIIGIHATLTGASSSPTSPSNAQMATIAATQAAEEPTSSREKANGDSIFIFKLAPPRPGLSKAVNFTKPMVHYFAVDNVREGRLWMAALVKATIDRDDTKPLTTTNSQKTISLVKARQMRQLPPALKGLDDTGDDRSVPSPVSDKTGQGQKSISGDGDAGEDDSGVSGLEKRSEDTKKTNSAAGSASVSFEVAEGEKAGGGSA